MAYTASVTKGSISQVGIGIYSATVNVTVSDEAGIVFEASVSAQYNANEPDLNGMKARLMEQLRQKWDKFAAERALFVHAAFDSMVAQIQTAATSYINS